MLYIHRIRDILTLPFLDKLFDYGLTDSPSFICDPLQNSARSKRRRHRIRWLRIRWLRSA